MLALCCELLTLVPETRAAGLISLLLAISHKNAFTAKLGDMGGGGSRAEKELHTQALHTEEHALAKTYGFCVCRTGNLMMH